MSRGSVHREKKRRAKIERVGYKKKKEPAATKIMGKRKIVSSQRLDADGGGVKSQVGGRRNRSKKNEL